MNTLLRDQAHNILVETLFYDFSMYIGGKTILVFQVLIYQEKSVLKSALLMSMVLVE